MAALPGPNLPREALAGAAGERMIVRCDMPKCTNAILMDPRPVFGGRRNWPREGRSQRFRCRCGHREAIVIYTRNATQPDGPVPPAAISLWF